VGTPSGNDEADERKTRGTCSQPVEPACASSTLKSESSGWTSQVSTWDTGAGFVLSKGQGGSRGRNMKTFRRSLRHLGTPCLAFLLCAALVGTNAQAGVSGPLQTVSPEARLKPATTDEYQTVLSQIVKNAQVTTGPKLKNPAIARAGLLPSIVSALREQRDYLEGHRTSAAPVNVATRETFGDNLPKPRTDPTCREPVIRSVNGKTEGVVFTPTAADNTYRIEGCFFGDTPGTVQLEARSGPHQPHAIQPIPMQLNSTAFGAWSDRELNVHLAPELSGIPDYRVTLVIYSARHRRIELRGCRFVAARGHPQLLTVIPSAWVRLHPSGVGSRSIRQLEYFSPTAAGSAVPKDAVASSAFVVRSDPERFRVGTDNYDFSQLNPGWVVESVQLQTYSVSCSEVAAPAQSFGRWAAEWTPLGVTVAFEDSVCTSSVSPSVAFNISLSEYAIRVWVVGPVGTQPLALVR